VGGTLKANNDLFCP